MSAGYLRKCLGDWGKRKKERYETKAEAEIARKASPIAGRLNSYSCSQCGGYHVGRIGMKNRGQHSRKPPKNAPRFLPCQ